VNYGRANVDEASSKNSIVLTDETRFNGREIDLEELHEIIYLRLMEIFNCVKKPLLERGHLDRVGSGIYLTGGTSLLPGIDRVAAEVFGNIPIVKSRAAPVNGVIAVAEDPRYSTAIGLIRYAQLQDQERPHTSIVKRIGTFVRDLFGAPPRSA
jgi:cell division protein FtsA